MRLFWVLFHLVLLTLKQYQRSEVCSSSLEFYEAVPDVAVQTQLWRGLKGGFRWEKGSLLLVSYIWNAGSYVQFCVCMCTLQLLRSWRSCYSCFVQLEAECVTAVTQNILAWSLANGTNFSSSSVWKRSFTHYCLWLLCSNFWNTLVIRTSVPDLTTVLCILFPVDLKVSLVLARLCDIIPDLHSCCLGRIR